MEIAQSRAGKMFYDRGAPVHMFMNFLIEAVSLSIAVHQCSDSNAAFLGPALVFQVEMGLQLTSRPPVFMNFLTEADLAVRQLLIIGQMLDKFGPREE